MSIMEHIEVEKVFETKDLIEYQEKGIASKTFVNKKGLNLTLLALDAEQELSTHSAPGDAYITILEGNGHVFIDGVRYDLTTHQSIVMPFGKPHSVHADSKMKFQLVLVKEEK